MSFIGGIFHRDDVPVDSHHLERILQTQAFPGVDRVGTWCDNRVALGQQTHVSLPAPPREPLPWRDTEAGLTISADVRLDNRDDLGSALSIPPGQYETSSDRQLLLWAYQKWGVDCPTHLLGDFAFAIWDAAKQCLFAARDVAGVRPLYYHLSDKRFYIASDFLALATLPGMPKTLDDTYMAEKFFSPLIFPDPPIEATIYAAVRRLPPAHAMIVSPDTCRIWQWWTPDQLPDVRRRSVAAYAEELRHLLHQAVTCRLRSAVPVGAQLRGGLDSSSVVVTAAQTLLDRGQMLPVFCWVPQVEPAQYQRNDERVWIDDIYRRDGIAGHYPDVTVWDAAHWRLRSAGDRYASPSIRERAVYRQTQAQGVGVMLSGLGGGRGISFSAFHYGYDYLFRYQRWWVQWRQARHIAAQTSGTGIRRWWSTVRRQPPRWMAPKRRCFGPGRFQDRQACFQPDFAARYTPREATKEITAHTVHQAQLELLLNSELQRYLMGWAADGAQHGIIYRYPLLDRRLIEFALGLPVTVLGRNGWDRYLFRYAMQDRLPVGMCWQWGTQKPSSDTNRHQVHRMFDTEVFIPLMDTLLAQGWPWQVLRPEGVLQCRERKRPSWSPALRPLRLEMMLNPDLEAEVSARLKAMQGT